MKRIIQIVFILFCSLILFLSIRGLPGNPTTAQLNTPEWKDDGPLELSPERGRFALMYSIVENQSVLFSLPIARFATPDVGYSHGNYVSLFAPALSYLVIPGYLAGRALGAAQVGAFAVVSLFAILNIILIYYIARHFKADRIASLLGGLAFLFGTPAFAYGVNLYQHHISTFIILSCFYLLLRSSNFATLLLVFTISAFSLPLDYPNLFLMLPIGLYALSKIIYFKQHKEDIALSFDYFKTLAFIGMIIPVLLFLLFNKASYGGPFNFLGGGSLSVAKTIDENGRPMNDQAGKAQDNAPGSVASDSGLSFFKTRYLLNGFYIHSYSPDRGILWYAPVVLFGIAGAFILYKRREPMLPILLGVVGMNVLLYSMWGDPYGGWAFGSRYLIPSYGIAGIFIAVLLSRFRKRSLFLAFFFIVLTYSIAVNTVGALSSSRNPPQAEVLALEKLTGREQKYTYARNFDFLVYNGSKSYAWQAFGRKYVSAMEYYYIITSLLVLCGAALLVHLRLHKYEN